jgi:hypothetical protein
MRQKNKEWAAVIIFISTFTVLTLWYLYLNPQYILRFLIAPIIGLAFAAVMLLFPKYRQRFVKKVVSFQVETQKRGGLLYRFSTIFNAVMITVLVLFCAVAVRYPAILDIPYASYLVAALFILAMISGAAYIYSFIRAAGKWALILIAIAAAMAVLSFLVRNL